MLRDHQILSRTFTVAMQRGYIARNVATVTGNAHAARQQGRPRGLQYRNNWVLTADYVTIFECTAYLPR